MKPQKVILYTFADEDRPALLIACPACGVEAGLWCGYIEGAIPGLYYVHSLRARRGAGEARRQFPSTGGD